MSDERDLSNARYTSEKYGFPERIGEHSVYMAAPESAKEGGTA